MLSSAISGFVASVVLIVAIGAQNAFVLRQGLRREHVLPVVLTCALSDLALILAGIAGLGGADVVTPGAQVMRGLTAMDSGVSLELEPRQQRVYASIEARFQISEPQL